MAVNSTGRNDRDIPIKIDGSTRFIKNVTKCTTCCDVIKMILKKLNIGKENLASYAIFESANGVDRPLAGKTSILKTVRSWGSDTSYRLVFRRSAPAVTYIPYLSEAKRQKLSQWSKSSTTSSSDSEESTDKEKELAMLTDIMKTQQKKYKKYRISDRELSRQLFSDDLSDDSMDEFMSKVDHKNLAEFWNFCNVVTETEIKRLSSHGVSKQMLTPNNFHGNVEKTSKVKYAVKKRLKHSSSGNKKEESHGKQELLKKYLSDYTKYETPKIAKMRKVNRRESFNYVKNSGTSTEYLTTAQHFDAYGGYWSVHVESDVEQTDEDSSFEKAFIDECSISERTSDSGITVKYTNAKTDNDYRACTERKLVDYSFSEEESEDDTRRNFNICDFWDTSNDYDEDTEMESFMKTKINEDFSDEGLSSMASDEEREILV